MGDTIALVGSPVLADFSTTGKNTWYDRPMG